MPPALILLLAALPQASAYAIQMFAATPRSRCLSLAMMGETPGVPKTGGYVQFCTEDVMSPKAHGSTEKPVQKNLRWNVDRRTANRICCFNRDGAEYRGYWMVESWFLREVSRDEPTIYYDSVTGKPLFVAPIGRSMESFLSESQKHGRQSPWC